MVGHSPAAQPPVRTRPHCCDGCNVCCTAMRVRSLDKPAGQPCSHQSPAGCGNYDHRPAECRAWYCLWVRDDGRIFADHHRPDRLGVFFTASSPDLVTGVQNIFAHEVFPGAAQTPEPREVINYLRQFARVSILPARTPTVNLTVEGAAC